MNMDRFNHLRPGQQPSPQQGPGNSDLFPSLPHDYRSNLEPRLGLVVDVNSPLYTEILRVYQAQGKELTVAEASVLMAQLRNRELAIKGQKKPLTLEDLEKLPQKLQELLARVSKLDLSSLETA